MKPSSKPVTQSQRGGCLLFRFGRSDGRCGGLVSSVGADLPCQSQSSAVARPQMGR